MLQRREGRILVFARYDKEHKCQLWHTAKVERGQLKLLVTAREWVVAITAAGMIATGKMSELGNWLDGYNAAVNADLDRASCYLLQ